MHEEDNGRFFTITDIDGTLGIAQTPCDANGNRTQIVARFPNTEDGQRRLDEQLDRLPLHVWM